MQAVPAATSHGSSKPRRLIETRGDLEKAGAEPNADRIADAGDDYGLQQDHAQDRAVGDTHGLESAELAQILEHEDVEGLADHCGADDEAQCDGDAEIHRNAGSLEVVADRGPGEVAPGQRLQSRLGRDPLGEQMRVHSRPRVHQYEGHLLARAPDVIPRARIFRVNYRVGGKGRGRVGNADDHRPVIVELDDFPDSRRFARPHELGPGPVDNHRVGLFQILDRAHGDPTSLGRSTANPDKSLVVAAVEKVPAPKNRTGKHGHAVKRQHGFFAGDARIAVLPAATGAELGAFLKANVAANSHLLTDGFAGYRGRDADLGEHLKHTPVVQGAGANAGQFFPIIHTLFSNIKAWLVGTHHGVSAKHLPRYLREWSYRFNRRNLPNGLDRYLIRRAVECASITYDQLTAGDMLAGGARVRRLPAKVGEPDRDTTSF